MNITLSADDEVVRAARKRAEALGKSLNQLVREYLEQLAGRTDPAADAREFAELSRQSNGNPNGWKFKREELYRERGR